MSKFFLILGTALLLTACQTTGTIQQVPQFNYTRINPNWIDCGVGKRINIPDPATLTDEQIVAYMSRMDNLYQECVVDASSVRAWEAGLLKKLMELNSKG